MDAKRKELADRITRDPNILTGKPTVRGTRISAELVLSYLAANPNLEDLFRGYPDLTIEDVQACLLLGAEQVRKMHRYRPDKQPNGSHSAVA
jgi:uncharacterized protein (DUF433 family)